MTAQGATMQAVIHDLNRRGIERDVFDILDQLGRSGASTAARREVFELAIERLSRDMLGDWRTALVETIIPHCLRVRYEELGGRSPLEAPRESTS